MHDLFDHIKLFLTHNQWATDIGILFFGMLIYHWISRKIYHFLVRKFNNGHHPWAISFVESVHIPWMTFFWLLIFSFIIQIFMHRFDIDLSKINAVNVIRSLLFIGAFYWSILRFITKMEEEIAPRSRKLPVRDRTTVRAIAQLSRVALTVIVILMILPMLGFHTGSLLAFGGVGGLAIGFAAKDTLSNFLGGMMIFWDRPFSVGDWISSPDRKVEGTVEHIGWRLTRIRTFSKRPIYVPNGVFSNIVIENPSRMSHRQINLVIGLRYDDLNVVDVITTEIEAMLRKHPSIDATQTLMVNLVELASSSVNLNLYAFSRTTDWYKFRQITQEILLKSVAIAVSHGAECAFPTTTVILAKNNDNNPPQST